MEHCKIGLAYGPAALKQIEINSDLIDYVEIPFELLRHNPKVIENIKNKSMILHCASLSISGFSSSRDKVIDLVNEEANRLDTPWIGEHLAYLSSDAFGEENKELVELNYTVCPQLSESSLTQTIENIKQLVPKLNKPLILENSPQYFEIPGSTMTLTEYVSEVIQSCQVNFLFDLCHFLISCLNLKKNPFYELEKLPLESIKEIHLSGYSVQSGVAWDDHSNLATETEFELLSKTLERANPKAITFEYNWGPDFSNELVESHISRVRHMVQ